MIDLLLDAGLEVETLLELICCRLHAATMPPVCVSIQLGNVVTFPKTIARGISGKKFYRKHTSCLANSKE